MFEWIVENIATIVICGSLLVVVASIIRGMIRNKKKGGSACGCGCEGCLMSSSCHPEK